MKTISVLGSGCKKCEKTAELIAQEAEKQQVEIQLEKDSSMQSLMKYQVMSTPAVVIDGVLVHSGGMPKIEAIRDWLSA